MPKRPSKGCKRRSPAYEHSESRSCSTCWASRLTLGRHEGCSGVPRGRQGFGLKHLVELPSGLAHEVGQLAERRLDIQPLGQRHGRPQLAHDLSRGQDDELRGHPRPLPQQHLVARMQPESSYISGLAEIGCLEKVSKIKDLPYPCNNAALRRATYRTGVPAMNA